MSAIDSTPENKREGPVAGQALHRLREEISAAHRAPDETLQIVDRLSAPDQRVGSLVGFHLLHRETGTKVEPFLGGLADLDFPARRRSPLIAEGLAVSVKLRLSTARLAQTFTPALKLLGRSPFSKDRAWVAASF
jgi:hypothetical protein